MTGPVCMLNIYYQDMRTAEGRELTAVLMNDLISEIREEFPDFTVTLSLLPGRFHSLVRIASGYADQIDPVETDEMFPYRPEGRTDNGEYIVSMCCQMNHVIISAGMKRAGIMRHMEQTLRKFGYECVYSAEVNDEDTYPVRKTMLSRLAAMIDSNLLEKLRSYEERRMQ